MGKTDARTIYVMAFMIAIAAIIGILRSTTGRAECVNTAGVDELPGYVVTLSVPESCTIFTASYGDTVLFGNNEDWFNPNTFCWAVPSQGQRYGAVYVGFDNLRPQGGINEKGLAFDINALPKATLNPHPELPKVEKPFYALLQTCATVEEVIDRVRHFTWGCVWRAQVHVADRTGDAVVISVGPDGEIAFTRKKNGNGYLVSTNFNRANPENGRYPCRRYDTAVTMLEKVHDEGDLTIAYVRSILDAVHQEGPSVNTVYSTIFDLKKGVVYLYHWHQFGEVVTLSVAEKVTGTPFSTRMSDLFSDETVVRASEMYQSYQKKVHKWENTVRIWVVLTVGALGVLVWGLAHGTRFHWMMRLVWILIVTLFGPLGLTVYLYSYRKPLRSSELPVAMANWKCALIDTMFSVTALSIGTTLAFISFYVVQPLNESGLLSIVARIYVLPMIVGLFFFHAPLTAVIAENGYRTAVRDRFSVAVTSLNFTLIGLLPVSGILLVVGEQTLGLRSPGSVLFWGVIILAAFAGALTVFPFNAWMSRRGFGCWAVRLCADGKIEREESAGALPSLRTKWAFLLLSFVLLGGSTVLIFSYIL